ncbi:two-component sensor histidine kinase [Bacillus pseudomycoides]|uniref:HAMP domain-containing sensor histidine kinase n=1 Tax=Bacillus pseudomycoides TaxID=64104 RepID=UPI000BEDE399|nr:HAMP domain-containing sensor histidine kinase [Bacillus pseudomycoides]PEA81565.1 two-component sensor histidine kinase [Bacillus pseudomycoides]PED05722.1 two-component sensor histidine kinase [Bacillus pseudomycoides]PED70644.1 two-component sensor histidine kinase [Bacillus pseudomycoides]PEI37420.1 two-component sensor histidine kinase [Bacillus pseudomycoides]PEJ81877.1 two-component sensor histidine kinase [Bacillus pseudomycoides]
MNIRRSLVTKYLLLIFASLFMWPILPAIYYLPDILLKQDTIHEPLEIEKMWEHEAEQLNEANENTINEKLGKIQGHYPKAELFWVDKAGKTHVINQRIVEIPDQWTPLNLINYLDRKKQQDIFTVTATIGKDGEQGFMVFHIQKSITTLAIQPVDGDLFLILIIFVVGVSIVVVSLLFFLSIRKRLVQLQSAMSDTVNDGIPDKVTVNNSDEIGQLEKAFNRMIDQLKDSWKREKEEEYLRKQLIANISHDLRTPLTVIRQHAYSIQNNPSSLKATASVQIIVNKLNDVGKLLENLLTYTLLSAGKYPLEKTNIDVIEELRNAVAEWYPVFEKEGFEVNVHLADCSLIWQVDPLWLRSIFDNLFQNVIRHASSGGYIGVETIDRDGDLFMVIRDKGRGMEHHSEAKGAGIGLSIVSLMTREMDVFWEVSSSPQGTWHYLRKKLN